MMKTVSAVEKLKYRRKIRPKLRRKLLLLAMIGTLLLIALLIDRKVRPIAKLQAQQQASAFAEEIIGSVVGDYIEKRQFTYGDFAAVLYDEKGRVVSVEALPLNINRAQAELAYSVNKRLSDTRKSCAHIALGSLSGSYMLAGKGPRIKLRICPAAKSSVELKSSFSSAGINQTCHKLSAVVTAELSSSLPIYSFETSVSFEFLLAESIIIGDIPEITRYAWNGTLTQN